MPLTNIGNYRTNKYFMEGFKHGFKNGFKEGQED